MHEEQVFSEIAQARSALIGARTPADKIAANGALDSALSRLLVITENYPQLKSNENFLRLQDELAGTENRIAVERRRYNEVVQDYNTYIATFPNSLVASIVGFTRNDAYFKTEEGARTAPKVNFDFQKYGAGSVECRPSTGEALIERRPPPRQGRPLAQEKERAAASPFCSQGQKPPA